MSSSMVFDITVAALQQSSTRISRLQEESASGSRVIRASDSPGDAYAIMDLNGQVSSIATYQKNIDSVSQDLGRASNALQQVSTTMTSIKSLLTQAASGTYGLTDRANMAPQIDSDLESIIALINTKSLGHYVFGGTSGSKAPYEVQRVNGQIQSVDYVGSQQESRVPIAPGVTQTNSMVGDRVFSSDQRQTPTFAGTTGVKAGDAASTVTGDVWLTVSHDTTTYLGPSGLTPGASTNLDTAVGGAHQLIVYTATKKVQFDDGPQVSYDASSTDLQLQNANGDTVYVDMSKMNPALTGNVVVHMKTTTRASIDDNATSVILDGSTNQAVTDSRTGKILYVNSSSLAHVGVEPVRVAGTYNLFNTLVQVRDILQNTRNLSASDQSDLLNQALQSVDEVSTGVTKALTSAGGRMQALDTLKTSMDTISGTATDQATQLQQADVASLAIDLSRTQTLYQMTLASTSKLLSLSMLDYMTTT